LSERSLSVLDLVRYTRSKLYLLTFSVRPSVRATWRLRQTDKRPERNCSPFEALPSDPSWVCTVLANGGSQSAYNRPSFRPAFPGRRSPNSRPKCAPPRKNSSLSAPPSCATKRESCARKCCKIHQYEPDS